VNFKERNKTNKAFLLIHFIITIVVPIGVIFMALDAKSNYADSKFYAGAFRLLFFFIGIPVYFVYAYKIIWEKFPKHNLAGFIMLFSVVLSLVYSLLTTYSGFLVNIQIAGLNVYLGLSIIFFFGIFYRTFFGLPKGKIVLKIIMFFVLLVLFFYSPAYLFGYGFYLNVSDWDDTQGLIRFFGTISLVIVIHIKPVLKLAKEKEI
jgi:hypothetical protein